VLFFLGSQSRCGDCVFQRRFCNGEGRGAELIRKDARRVRWVRPGARIRRSSASFRMYIYNYNYIYIHTSKSVLKRFSKHGSTLSLHMTWPGIRFHEFQLNHFRSTTLFILLHPRVCKGLPVRSAQDGIWEAQLEKGLANCVERMARQGLSA